jgi:hypothetical protein
MVYLEDVQALLIPDDAECFQERALMDAYFPTNYSDFFPDRATSPGRYVSVLVYAKDGGSIFREAQFSQAVGLDTLLTNQVSVNEVDDQGWSKVYKWSDLCSKHQGSCLSNEILKLANVVKDIESGVMDLMYPFTFHPVTNDMVVTAGSIANPTVKEDGKVGDTRAVVLQYNLDSSSEVMSHRYGVPTLAWLSGIGGEQ